MGATAGGTFRGVDTNTVLTNECGYQGERYGIPFLATPIGDVPPAITIADPAYFADSASFNAPHPSAATAPVRVGDQP